MCRATLFKHPRGVVAPPGFWDRPQSLSEIDRYIALVANDVRMRRRGMIPAQNWSSDAPPRDLAAFPNLHLHLHHYNHAHDALAAQSEVDVPLPRPSVRFPSQDDDQQASTARDGESRGPAHSLRFRIRQVFGGNDDIRSNEPRALPSRWDAHPEQQPGSVGNPISLDEDTANQGTGSQRHNTTTDHREGEIRRFFEVPIRRRPDEGPDRGLPRQGPHPRDVIVIGSPPRPSSAAAYQNQPLHMTQAERQAMIDAIALDRLHRSFPSGSDTTYEGESSDDSSPAQPAVPLGSRDYSHWRGHSSGSGQPRHEDPSTSGVLPPPGWRRPPGWITPPPGWRAPPGWRPRTTAVTSLHPSQTLRPAADQPAANLTPATEAPAAPIQAQPLPANDLPTAPRGGAPRMIATSSSAVVNEEPVSHRTRNRVHNAAEIGAPVAPKAPTARKQPKRARNSSPPPAMAMRSTRRTAQPKSEASRPAKRARH
ncbi:hypothetical protein BU16DRAFT_289989 [Lophium mytilinum]|uniref:Uncharacterized protein n=1 Tax=Lophium mytilinum TaxID=390894 RepID=A0A6A6R0N1_9PEZI|nr:hypothetical protein BU16DRAFT_289989 [Lophium mytilinum]